MGLLAIVGPGVLVAATGVGAGDLAGGAIAGSILGLSCLWAVVLGSGVKLLLTENLARWQIATGSTILEGAIIWLGRPVQILFWVYLIPWTLFTGGALISATGITAHAIVPVFGDQTFALGDDEGLLKREVSVGRLVLGGGGSLLALALAWFGGFRLFERVMSVCVAAMFVVVVVSASMLAPNIGEMLGGLLIPKIPEASEMVGQDASFRTGLIWTIALMGGVGGTLTIICYSYWMREAGRDGRADLGVCRLDATLGYAMTAVFGIAMVVIGSRVVLERGGSAGVLVKVADQLAGPLGSFGREAFLWGAFFAVFSSVLGVWQAVPYVYADLWRLGSSAGRGGDAPAREPVNTRCGMYRGSMVAIATVPMVSLFVDFAQVQKAYTVFGALFVPALAGVVLVLNGKAMVGELRNGRWMSVVLAIVVLVGIAAMIVTGVQTFG